MLKALVFDFDGVIVDTETQWYYIYRDWLKKVYHYDLSIQDYLVCVGSSSERLFAFLKQKLGTDEDIREFEKQAMAEFIERTRTLPAMEGVTELVTAAKKKRTAPGNCDLCDQKKTAGASGAAAAAGLF